MIGFKVEYDENGDAYTPDGTFTIYVSDMQPDTRSQKLTGKTVLSATI